MGTPFKLRGMDFGNSPMTKKTDHPKKEVPPEHKDLEVTKSSNIAKINDIENRIEFLKSDLEEETNIMKKGKVISKVNKLKKALKKLKT